MRSTPLLRLLALVASLGMCTGFAKFANPRPLHKSFRGKNFRGMKPLAASASGGGEDLSSGSGGVGGVGGGDGGDGGIGGPPAEKDGSDSEEESDPKKDVDVVVESAGTFVFLSKLLDFYSKLLDIAPIPTKMISSLIVGGLGDVLLQKINGDPLDFRRLMVFSTVTMFYIAPMCHFWYNTLEMIPTPANLGPVLQNALKLLVDQSIGAVMVNMGFFFSFELSDRLYPPYQAGRNSFIAAGINSCKNNLWGALLANWTCWPIINYVNLMFVPLKYRVLFSNFAAVFWNMFLSSVVNRKADPALAK